MSMRSILSGGLDLVDAMDKRSGYFDASFFGRGIGRVGAFGAAVKSGYKFENGWAAIATGEAGYYYNNELSGLGYQFGLGVRKKW